jgi:hypothetical protein
MAAFQKRLGSFLVGLYVWVLAISFGMVLIDILYARLVPDATIAFSEVSDFLLLISLATLLLAIVTLAFSRKSRAASNLIIASQLIFLLEFLIPAFFTLLGLNMQGNPIGPWLRITPCGAASIVAFIGLYQYNQQK